MEILEHSQQVHQSEAVNPDVSEGRRDDSGGSTLQESVVGPAWELVMNTSLLKKFNFFPSFLSTLYLSGIILYQLAFAYVYIFELKDQFFALVIQWVHASYFWQIIAILCIGMILYILTVPIAE